MKKLTAKIVLLMICLVHLTARAEVPQLPEDWYLNPEDAEAEMTAPFFPTLPWTKKGKMERLVKSIYEVNRSSVELASEKKSSLVPKNTIPNWTPWHLEAFTTELSVVGSGLIGILTTGKGAATALAYWRRPVTSGASKTLIDIENENENENDSLPTFNADNVFDDSSLKKEIEPIIKSALGTGKIKDEMAFRCNVETAASEFYNLINGLQVDPAFKWFVSGIRIDFSVSASGALIPSVPVATVGGDVRIRFDIRRLARQNANRAVKLRNSASEMLGFAGSQSKLQGKLRDLVTNLAQDLNSTFDEDFETKGFKPFSFRFGLGFSASGDVGIAKSSATSIAYVTFSQDVRDPARRLSAHFAANTTPLLLIEQNPSEKHLQFATNNLIPYSLEANRTRAVYSVDRGNFRKGLRKAVKMANFFVSAGKKAGSKKWKLYQMRTAFEFSITGNVGLAKYSGISTADMAFYNMSF